MDYLFDTSNFLAHPLTKVAVVAIAASLLATPIVAYLLRRARLVNEETGREIRDRHITSLLLAPLLVIPLLLCPGSAIIAITIMSLLCNREFTKATGQFRERILAGIVIISIIAVGFANLDNWPGLHAALPPLVITAICGAAVLPDRPNRYLQRVAVASFGFLLFGSGLGHLGFIANDPNYRPILVLLIMSAQLSDIAAYCIGKAIGRRRPFINTSPNKSLEGYLGAILIIAPLSAYAAHFVFKGTDLDDPLRLGVLGLIIALGSQLGDLVLASIKRDIGVTEMANTLPGHGGFLDRFNSLLIIAPAAFHYINHFDGFHMIQTHSLLEHMR